MSASLDDFGLIKWNLALNMMNIFAITFYQPYITVFEILVKNRNKITNQGQ